jgi:hypothetical protein
VKITTDLLATMLGGTTIRLKVIVHGDAIACLSGVRVEAVERSADSVTFDVVIDGLSTLLRLVDLVSADVLDVAVTTR